MGRQTRRAGANKSRGEANMRPTDHPELILGDSEEEAASRPESPEARKPERRKAGR